MNNDAGWGQVLLVDGRSGAGKTTIAGTLAREFNASLIHVEHFYPGWNGLEAGAAWLVTGVLEPWSRGETVRLREWDWHADEFREGDTLAPGGNLIIEGCGAISRASAPFASLSVWLEADERLRRNRATTRDGDESWWDGWSEEEREFYAKERSPELAHRILDSTEPSLATLKLVAELRDAGWPEVSEAAQY